MANVLIVDDDPVLRGLLRRVLEPTHSVWEAEDGEAALCLLRTVVVDLVLCDILMPNKEGLETINEIRQRDPNTIIIAMSGGGIIDPLPLAQRMGANRVLYKPFSAPELTQLVAGYNFTPPPLQSHHHADPSTVMHSDA